MMLLWLIVVAALDVFSWCTLYLHLEVGMIGRGGQDQLQWICAVFLTTISYLTLQKKNKTFNLIFLQIMKKSILFWWDGGGQAYLEFRSQISIFYFNRNASPKQRIFSILLIVIVICKNILLSFHSTILSELQNFKIV